MQESIPPPPRIEGRGPTLAKIDEVESILRAADEPISVNEVMRRMKAKAVDRRSVNLAIAHLARFGVVVTGSKGVQWVPPASPQLQRAISKGKRL
ncbi:MAG: hypothetical protein QOE90_2699 [Thermoplasmata archaeon]|jgi:hypothetical protein|nr:hypothetical protein [Thermoplasmata archaeon]